MPFLPFILIICAALTHALWNFFVKGGEDKLVTLWLVIGFMVVVYTIPVAITFDISDLAWPTWGFLLATGCIHAVYFFLLASAYTYGDISLAYPIARGSGIVFTALFSTVLFKEFPSLWGTLGIAVVVLGVFMLMRRGRNNPRPVNLRTVLLSVGVGLTLWGFYSVDKIGIAYLPPYHYMYFLIMATFLILTPFILIFRRKFILNEIRVSWKQVIAGGVVFPFSYIFSLWAMTLAPLAYVSGVREVSIAFGATLGVIFYRERPILWRILGACIIASGVLVIGLRG